MPEFFPGSGRTGTWTNLQKAAMAGKSAKRAFLRPGTIRFISLWIVGFVYYGELIHIVNARSLM